MRRIRTVGALALVLNACSLAPPYVRPAPPVPPSWPAGDAYLVRSEAALPSVSYRQVFRDPRLQRLIAQALAGNRDLRLAAATIAAARAQYRIQRAELLPEVDASGTYRYAHDGGGGGTATTVTQAPAGSDGGTTTGTGTVTTAAPGAGRTSSFTAEIGITAFEIDLFGRVRSLTAAARDRYFATEAAARATRLTLVGDVADAWIATASDRSLLALARRTADSAGRSVTLTRVRLASGVAARADVDQSRLILHTAELDVAARTTQVAQDVNALQLLVGAPVDATLLPASIDEALPTIAELPPGLDSAILLRRPDVVEAEYALRAANAEIGAARAQLFPRLSLTGLLGFASTALTDLFTGGAFHYSAGTGIGYPIFRAGAARAGVRYSEAERDAALATYEKTIQTAFSEVADALARRGTIDAQSAAARDLAAAAADNYVQADARYRAGVETFLNDLDAQRSLYAAQQTLVATKLTRAGNLVTLYRSIGGDALLDATSEGPQPPAP